MLFFLGLIVLLKTLFDESRLRPFKILSVFVAEFDLGSKLVEISVDPDITNAAGKDVVETVQGFEGQPFARDSTDKDGSGRGSDAMLW